MQITTRIFVGRKNELEQLKQALGQPSLINRLLLANPGRNVKSRVFLPHGIGGIGKSELSRQCRDLATKAGWKTLLLDWDRVGSPPAEAQDVMDALADALKTVAGAGSISTYLDDRKLAAGVQEKAQRYRTEHPEEWQKILTGVSALQEKDPEPYTKAALAVVGGMLDIGPKALAKLADAMIASRSIKAKEADLLTKPHIALARHLVQCIVQVAKSQGLVIVFDTCEILSLALEEFLRDQIVCPAIEQTYGLIAIVSGRYSQRLAREVEDRDGQHRRVKGYADRLSDPPPTDWNLSQFAEPEIAAYLRESNFHAKPELIAYIQQTARGVPFAVQLLVEALHALGPEQVQREFPPGTNDVDLPNLVQMVVQRFLHYCLANPTDQNRVRALAVLRERDNAALSAVWELPAAASPSAILDELHSRYGFIQSDRTLHEVVRSFLRENLQADERETAHRLGALAVQHYLPLWQAETATFPQLADRIAESRWQRITLNTLNALCWSDEPAAIRFLVGRALEALEFNWGFAKGLLKLAREFRTTESWWSTRTCRQFDNLAKVLEGSEAEELAGLEALQRDGTELGLDDTGRCILHMWRARNLTKAGQAHEALAICQAAEKHLFDDEGLHRALAQRYANIGSALGFPKGIAIVSQEGKIAYERAVALAPDQSGYHSGLGGLLNQMGDIDRAMMHYGRAIELDHTNSSAYSNRGTGYDALKDYEKALVDYNKAIDLDPHYAIAYYNRGNTYRNLKNYTQALADYSKAIDLDPQDAIVYNNRGITYRNLKDYTQALADYTQAINLDPQDASTYYNRGNTYRNLKNYTQALADYTQAINLDPQDAATYNNRGATYEKLKNYEKALADYSKAINLDPHHARVYYNLGDIYYKLKEYEKALANYTQAIQQDPNCAYYFSHRGVIHYCLGQDDDAQRDFDQALALEADNSVFTDLATRSVLAGDAAEAIFHLRKAFELDAQDLREYLEDDPDFDSIRNTLEFQALLKEFEG